MTTLLVGVGAIAVAGLGAAVLRRRRSVHAVDPELRNPMMWPPLSIGSRLELALGRRLFLPATTPVEGVDVRSYDVPGGLDVLVYDPTGRERPGAALVWIHGGGLVMGTPEVAHHTCSLMARELGILVVSVRYRLAPEHPFPAGLDDCRAALRWVVASTDRLGVDPARIAVGGDSAGGGLAAAVAQWATDEGIALALQLLVYPMLDDRTALRERDLRGRLVWTPRSNRWAWSAYLGHRAGGAEDRPYAVAARRADLTGLPPAWIGVGDLDLFHDEDLAYARRLEAAGVPVTLHVQPGMPHGLDLSPADPGPVTRSFLASWLGALGSGLAAAGGLRTRGDER